MGRIQLRKDGCMVASKWSKRNVALADSLARLAAAICGERTYSLEEANAAGYFSVKQIADSMPVSEEVAARNCSAKFRLGKIERVKLRRTGAGWAYKLKKNT